ncbi:nudix hydrolase-like protein 16 [Perilla frutescens var. frutescens]|nr:nudix hydrolase-like protein 16 [Perilla frutescens var. frutescens]
MSELVARTGRQQQHYKDGYRLIATASAVYMNRCGIDGWWPSMVVAGNKWMVAVDVGRQNLHIFRKEEAMAWRSRGAA